MKLVVGNKLDQVGRRRVSTEEGWEGAERRGFMFLETSARNRAGVDTAFNKLVERILQEPGMWERESDKFVQKEACQGQGVRFGQGGGRIQRSEGGCCN